MRYGIKCNGRPQFFLQYEEGEWEELKVKLEGMGLTQKTTANLWGQSIAGKFYKEANSELQRYVKNTMGTLRTDNHNLSAIRDDINSPLVSGNTFNIAIFRVVPDENKRIETPIEKFFTVLEINEVGKIMSMLYQVLFNIVAEAEVTIEKRS